MKKTLRRAALLCAALCLMLAPGCAAEDDASAALRDMLLDKIVQILDTFPTQEPYAVMLFLAPNPGNAYRGYTNLPELTVLYKGESDMGQRVNPFFRPSGEDEERWNPAFWDYDRQQTVIGYDAPNPLADALIDWYERTGVADIGVERDDGLFDDMGRYIGTGPGGLPELLGLVTDVARTLQTDGVIEERFGRGVPVLIADLEFTWYMIRATREANPDGQADAYVGACVRQGWVYEDLIQ